MKLELAYCPECKRIYQSTVNYIASEPVRHIVGIDKAPVYRRYCCAAKVPVNMHGPQFQIWNMGEK